MHWARSAALCQRCSAANNQYVSESNLSTAQRRLILSHSLSFALLHAPSLSVSFQNFSCLMMDVPLLFISLWLFYLHTHLCFPINLASHHCSNSTQCKLHPSVGINVRKLPHTDFFCKMLNRNTSIWSYRLNLEVQKKGPQWCSSYSDIKVNCLMTLYLDKFQKTLNFVSKVLLRTSLL